MLLLALIPGSDAKPPTDDVAVQEAPKAGGVTEISYSLLSRSMFFVKLEEGASYTRSGFVGGEHTDRYSFRIEGAVCHRLVVVPEYPDEAGVSMMAPGTRTTLGAVPLEGAPFGFKLSTRDDSSDGLHHLSVVGAGRYTLEVSCD